MSAPPKTLDLPAPALEGIKGRLGPVCARLCADFSAPGGR